MALNSFTSGAGAGYDMQFMVQRAVGAYSNEVYTAARKLSGTGIVGANADINTGVEDFIGQFRWYNTLSSNINVPDVTNAADGTPTEITSSFAKYVKTVRTHGARNVNIQKVISQEDGLAKISRDFGETKAQDEHNSILECLNGVAASECARGAGIVSFTTDADNGSTGFFVDINAAGTFGAAATIPGDSRRLFDDTVTGAARGERLFKSMGMAWKDYESDFYYMVTSPEVLADIRAANLVDDTVVTDGNLVFQTIYNGKFRLLLTRAMGADQSGSANVNDQSTKTTYIVKPSALAMAPLSIETPVEMDRVAKSYGGSGTTEIWYRWGYVVHPMGYDWGGLETKFVAKAGVGGYDQATSWDRMAQSYLNLGILPLFHS